MGVAVGDGVGVSVAAGTGVSVGVGISVGRGVGIGIGIGVGVGNNGVENKLGAVGNGVDVDKVTARAVSGCGSLQAMKASIATNETAAMNNARRVRSNSLALPRFMAFWPYILSRRECA